MVAPLSAGTWGAYLWKNWLFFPQQPSAAHSSSASALVTSPIRAGVLTCLILCKLPACSQSRSEFLRAADLPCQEDTFPAVLMTSDSFIIFLPPSWWSLILEVCYRFPFRAEHSTVSSSLHLDQLLVFILIPNYCRKKRRLLWWGWDLYQCMGLKISI